LREQRRSRGSARLSRQESCLDIPPSQQPSTNPRYVIGDAGRLLQVLLIVGSHWLIARSAQGHRAVNAGPCSILPSWLQRPSTLDLDLGWFWRRLALRRLPLSSISCSHFTPRFFPYYSSDVTTSRYNDRDEHPKSCAQGAPVFLLVEATYYLLNTRPHTDRLIIYHKSLF
jgi:hypothetical protein